MLGSYMLMVPFSKHTLLCSKSARPGAVRSVRSYVPGTFRCVLTLELFRADFTNQQTSDRITHTNTLVRANLPQRAKKKTRKTGIDTGGPGSSHRLPVGHRSTKVILEMTPAGGPGSS